MLRRLAVLSILCAALATATVAPATASASSEDLASTHAYLVSSYKILHGVVSTWPAVEASIHSLDVRLGGECPDAGAGSPENQLGGRLSYEVAGALWATGYHTDASLIHAYVHTLQRLRWSNPQITRDARSLARNLQEMAELQVPDLCSDIHAWQANAFGPIPTDVEPYDRHVEALEINEIPRRLLVAYVQPSDQALRARDEHLDTRYEELEFVRGQIDWIAALETLGLNE
jgi:hypothetical protein